MKFPARLLFAFLLTSPALVFAMDLGTSPQQVLTVQDMSGATKPYSVAIVSSGSVQVPAGTAVPITFTISNHGSKDDTYKLVSTSDVAWGDFANTFPPLPLKAGTVAQYKVSITVPASAKVGAQGHFSLKASSQTNPATTDNADIVVSVTAAAH